MSTKVKTFTKALAIQVFAIGLLKMGETVFFFFEQNYFNTYLGHVLGKTDYYVTILVSSSAVMGVITHLIWGVICDNTRTKWGCRRPYFLFGGIVAGIAMMLYGFSNSFWLCLFLDAFIIAIATNAYLVAERSIIPDSFEVKLRGRANGIINVMANLGLLIAFALFLVVDLLYSVPNPDPEGTGTIIPQNGHQLLFLIGGAFIMIGGVLAFILVKEKPMCELPPPKKFFDDIASTFKIQELREQKDFFKIFVALTIFRTGNAVIMPFLFLFIFDLGLSTMDLLIAVAISFTVLFVMTYLLGRIADKHGRKRFLPIALLIIAAGVFLVPWTFVDGQVNYPLVLFSFPFLMVALLGFTGLLDAWSQDLLPEDKRGQFNGILNLTNTVSQVAGAALGGFVAVNFGRKWIFAFAPIFFILSIPFFLFVKETLENPYEIPEKEDLLNTDI